jgi:hypothetical protein
MWWAVNAMFRPVYPRERAPVPILKEVGYALVPLWMAAGNLAPSGVRTPNRPAPSDSLYGLRYPDSLSLPY